MNNEEEKVLLNNRNNNQDGPLNNNAVGNYLNYSQSEFAKEWRKHNGPYVSAEDKENEALALFIMIKSLPYIILLWFIFHTFAIFYDMTLNTIFTDKIYIIEIDDTLNEPSNYNNDNNRIKKILYANSFSDITVDWLLKNGYKKLHTMTIATEKNKRQKWVSYLGFNSSLYYNGKFEVPSDTLLDHYIFVNTKTNSTVMIDIDYGNGYRISLNKAYTIKEKQWLEIPEITLKQFDEENKFPKNIIKRIDEKGCSMHYVSSVSLGLHYSHDKINIPDPSTFPYIPNDYLHNCNNTLESAIQNTY